MRITKPLVGAALTLGLSGGLLAATSASAAPTSSANVSASTTVYATPYLGSTERIEGAFAGVSSCLTMCVQRDYEDAARRPQAQARNLKVLKEREGLDCRIYYHFDTVTNVGSPGQILAQYWTICKA